MKRFLAKLLLCSMALSSAMAVGIHSVWAEDIAAVVEENKVTNEDEATYVIISENPDKTKENGAYCYYHSGSYNQYTHVSTSYNDYYYYGTYSLCENLKTVVIGNGVDALDYGTLSFLTLDELVFPQNSVAYKTDGYGVINNQSSYGRTTYAYPASFYNTSAKRYYVSKDFDITLNSLGTKIVYDYNDGKLLYALKEDDTYEIIYSMPGNTSISIPSMLNGKKVTSAADGAFKGRSELETVTIPSSMTSIGASAFEDCTSLKSVILPSSVTAVSDRAFYGCTSLKNIYLSSKVQGIGDHAFYGCGLTAVTIPASVSKIGESAFSGCSALDTIKVSGGAYFTAVDNVLFTADKTRLISYASGKNEDEYIIPESVESIDAQAFTSLSSLNKITVPENIKTIGENAFITGNKAVTATVSADSPASDISVYPDGSSVVNIETDAQNGTYKVSGVLNSETLESYAIPEKYYEYTCTEIGDSAFNSCTALTGIVIPDTVTRIGEEAFMSCTSLRSIVIPFGVAEIGEVCFASDESLTEIEIPPTVTELSQYCFFGCSALTVTCEKASAADDISIYPEGSVIKYTSDAEGSLAAEFNHSCSFGNNLAVNYYVADEYLDGYENIRLKVRKKKYNEDGSDYSYTETTISTYTIDSQGRYRFVLDNIAAKEIGDELYAELHAEKDGAEYVSNTDEYSAKTYAYNRLEKSTDDKFRTLLVDMLDYGTQAQKYFNYNTSSPVNGMLTSEQRSYGTAEPAGLASCEDRVTIASPTAFITNKSVVFNSNTELKYYMTFEPDQDMSDVKLVLSYTSIAGTQYTETIKASDFVYDSANGRYTAKLVSIAAKDAGCPVSAAIYDGDVQISDTLIYSIETYAYNRMIKSSDESFKALVRSMMTYCDSAKNYFM